jgi:arylsulfatase A-like enzyme
MPQAKPPNFLFIIADQLRADHLGCYGNTVVRTPNLDRLAAEAFVADRFHVASPICMPNRASLLTGRMPSLHGVRHNGIPLSLRASNFVERLRQNGYRTALVGKSHLQNMTGTPPLWPRDPADRRHGEALAADGGRYDQEWKPNWRERPDYDVDLPFYGFDTVRLTIDHGDDLEGHYRRWLRAQRADADALIGPANAIPTPGLALGAVRQAWRTRLPPELHPVWYCARMSEDFLEATAAGGAPFFLMCSFAEPHHPFVPPGEYWDMYQPADIALPRSFRDAANRPPPHVAKLLAERDAGRAVKHTPQLFACTEQEAREAIALNYGSISFIDVAVGRLLARLEALGIADNTVVVFTSDHGDFMGDHQLLLKGPIHYRGLIQVPMIWRDPAAQARRSSALMGAIDMAPTILARAGLQPFNGVQGRSFAPVVAGEATAHHPELVVEEEGQRPQVGFEGRVRMRSLVTDRYRLSLYDGVSWGEIYDLANDPDELVNLWDDAASTGLRAELVLRLAHKMIGLSETSPYPTAAA